MTLRDLGGVDPARLIDNVISRYYFVRIDFKTDPVTQVWYTNKPGGLIDDIGDTLNGVASGSQTWVETDFRVQNLSQTQNNILEVSALDFSNLDGQWSTWMQDSTIGLRGHAVGVYVVWFDPADAILGMYPLFAGQMDATRIGQRAELSLTPFTTPHSVIVPGGEYSSTCVQIYKDEFCQYAGGLTSCDRTLDGLNGCRVHENVIHFAGFPFLPAPNTTMVWGTGASTVKFIPG